MKIIMCKERKYCYDPEKFDSYFDYLDEEQAEYLDKVEIAVLIKRAFNENQERPILISDIATDEVASKFNIDLDEEFDFFD